MMSPKVKALIVDDGMNAFSVLELFGRREGMRSYPSAQRASF
jgi:hypothetical protein